MRVDEIDLGEDEQSRRKAIQDNLDKQVILKDEHEFWCHCKIEGYGKQVYSVQIEDGRGKIELHYHDLNQLIVLEDHPSYPIPSLNASQSPHSFWRRLLNK